SELTTPRPDKQAQSSCASPDRADANNASITRMLAHESASDTTDGSRFRRTQSQKCSISKANGARKCCGALGSWIGRKADWPPRVSMIDAGQAGGSHGSGMNNRPSAPMMSTPKLNSASKLHATCAVRLSPNSIVPENVTST